MSSLKQGSLLVAQEDITDARTGDVLIRKDAHMMYLQRVSSRLKDFGHRVIDASTLKQFLLDPGVEIIDSDGSGMLFVVRGRYPDLPIHGRHIKMDGCVSV